jgi:hypothetical protein
MFKLSDGGDFGNEGLAIMPSQDRRRDAFRCAGTKDLAAGSRKGGACGMRGTNF